MKQIYLDNQASTPLDPLVKQEYIKYLDVFANPSSNHDLGHEAKMIFDRSVKKVASVYDCIESELCFLSGATEANNLAITGTCIQAKLQKSKRHKIFVSAIEHKSVLESAAFAAKLCDLNLQYLPVLNDGKIDLNFMESVIDEDTLLVSIMSCNNEIGVYQPVEEISKICKKHGVIYHVDAVQSQFQDIIPWELGIDLMSISSHKIYGPKGVGLLYIDNDLSLKPKALIYGGSQQGQYRSGTIPSALIAAFSKAIELNADRHHHMGLEILKLRDYMLDNLLAKISGSRLNGCRLDRHPGNINIILPGIQAHTLINNLQPEVAISAGSACNSGIITSSHVLRAIGLSKEDADSSIRISLGKDTTISQIQNVIDLMRVTSSTL